MARGLKSSPKDLRKKQRLTLINGVAGEPIITKMSRISTNSDLNFALKSNLARDDDDSDLESQEQEVMELIAKRNQGVSNKNFEAFNESSSEEMASEMDSDSASEDKDDGRSEQMDLQNELIIKDLKFYETRLVKVKDLLKILTCINFTHGKGV